MKCRVGGKRGSDAYKGYVNSELWGKKEMGIKVKGSRNDNGGCGKKDGMLSKGKKK